MVVIFQIAKTFAAKVVCRSISGLLIWCSAIVPTTKGAPPGVLGCLGYCGYMGSPALADDPPRVAQACELGTYQFL